MVADVNSMYRLPTTAATAAAAAAAATFTITTVCTDCGVSPAVDGQPYCRWLPH